MAEKWWVIVDSKGAMRQVVTSGVTPDKAGEDMTGRTAYPMARRGDMENETPNLTNGTWSENLAKIKALLLDQIDDHRESEQMKYLTTGGAKKMIYTQKAKEVLDFRALGSAVLATLNLENRRQRFPAAMAESELTGVALPLVIAKFESGANTANAKVDKIEAWAQRAKELVRTATTSVAAKQAAATPIVV